MLILTYFLFLFYLTVASFDFSLYDCFLIIILSHGGANNLLCAYDQPYNLNETIIDPIVKNNHTLAKKPKIFIIQVGS